MKNIDKKSFLLILIIVLTATASFGLGRLSIKEKYREENVATIIVPKLDELKIDKSLYKFVASKNGTKYYPINCKSVSRIKEENKIYFESAEEAEKGGLELTTSC